MEGKGGGQGLPDNVEWDVCSSVLLDFFSHVRAICKTRRPKCRNGSYIITRNNNGCILVPLCNLSLLPPHYFTEWYLVTRGCGGTRCQLGIEIMMNTDLLLVSIKLCKIIIFYC